MSVRLTSELNAVLDSHDFGALPQSWISFLRVCAESAHHEDDDAHKDGGPRKAGKQWLPPRHLFMSQETIARRMGCRPANVGRIAREIEEYGLRLRVGKAHAGLTTTYRFPDEYELWDLIARRQLGE